MQEDEEAVGPSSSAEQEAADTMQEDEEDHAGRSLGGGEAAEVTEKDEEAAAGPSFESTKVANMMQEDEDAARSDSNDDGDEAAAGPSSADGAESSIQTGPLSTEQKAMMKTMLQRMFKHNAGARHGLAQLVEQFNKLATKPASAEWIQQASSDNQAATRHGHPATATVV